MTTQTPATAEMEKWLRIRVRVFKNFWLQIRVRKKNAESCRSRLWQPGSGTTSGKCVHFGAGTSVRPDVKRNSDLLLFFSYFAFQNKEIKSGN